MSTVKKCRMILKSWMAMVTEVFVSSKTSLKRIKFRQFQSYRMLSNRWVLPQGETKKRFSLLIIWTHQLDMTWRSRNQPWPKASHRHQIRRILTTCLWPHILKNRAYRNGSNQHFLACFCSTGWKLPLSTWMVTRKPSNFTVHLTRCRVQEQCHFNLPQMVCSIGTKTKVWSIQESSSSRHRQPLSYPVKKCQKQARCKIRWCSWWLCLL